jgi:hypothetical protein
MILIYLRMIQLFQALNFPSKPRHRPMPSFGLLYLSSWGGPELKSWDAGPPINALHGANGWGFCMSAGAHLGKFLRRGSKLNVLFL